MRYSALKLFSSITLTVFLLSGCGSEQKKEVTVSSASDSLSAVYLSTAVKTAAWLKAAAIETPHGITWYANPLDSATNFNTLYYGSPGILLYFLELHHVTKDSSYLHTAELAANDLLAIVSDPTLLKKTGFTVPEDNKAGFYTGISGVGYSLGEMYSATKDKKYLDGMMGCVQLLKDWAVVKNNAATWSTTEDVFGGDAGTGLFLLYAYELSLDTSIRALAAQSGNFLISKGIQDKGGLKWPMEPSFERLMPNFSHGSSGVSYFLLRLFKVTGNKEYFAAVVQGANYLLASADDKTGLLFHHEGDGVYKGKCGGPGCIKYDTCIGNSLYYLGWCHGPAGTNRFYYLMGQETKDTVWDHLMQKSSGSVMSSGIPEKLTEGFWNNLGQCCGTAGVGDYYLNLYRFTKNEEYLRYAKHLAEFTLSKAVEESGGIKFPHAENNRQRDVVYAQTGYMTGAAGIGMFFLHMYEHEKKIESSVQFPDNPF